MMTTFERDHCQLCLPEPEGPVMFENPYVRVYHSMEGDIPGYLVLQSRRHVSSISQLSLLEAVHFNRTVRKTVEVVERQLAPERVYILSIGEKVRHLHVHIFPRYDWMENEYRLTGATLFDKVRADRGFGMTERTTKSAQRLSTLFARVASGSSRRMPIQVEIVPYRMTDSGPLFLILHRVPDRGGFWQPVTGGLHEGETLQECALRELYEEVGSLDVRRVFPINHTFQFEVDGGKMLTEYCFAAELGDEYVKISTEHDNFRWVSYDTAMEMLKWDDNKKAVEQLYRSLCGDD